MKGYGDFKMKLIDCRNFFKSSQRIRIYTRNGWFQTEWSIYGLDELSWKYEEVLNIYQNKDNPEILDIYLNVGPSIAKPIFATSNTDAYFKEF